MNYTLKNPCQFLGQAAELSDVQTYAIDELKELRGYHHVATTLKSDSAYWDGDAFKPGGEHYNVSPFAWIDLPKNHLEYPGERKRYRKDNLYRYEWKGRAILFKDPNRYLQSLSMITDPLKFITYLKYAPTAGFNIDYGAAPPAFLPSAIDQNPIPAYGAARRYAPWETLNGAFRYKLPDEVFSKWWMEVLTWHFLKTSFTVLRAAQIEDERDLSFFYDNTSKIIPELMGEMLSPVTVAFSSYNPSFGGNQRIDLELRQWEIDRLRAGIEEIRHLIDENSRKVAQRIIQLRDVDAEIVQTDFSTDPLQNPYLVYDPEKKVFVNVARNASATWAPPTIIPPPEDMQYWEQVPEFEREHARIYMTEQGPMSLADMRKYGLEREKTNWLPWLAAGAAVAYAASELI